MKERNQHDKNERPVQSGNRRGHLLAGRLKIKICGSKVTKNVLVEYQLRN